MTTPHLRAKAAAVLPAVDTIALREALASRPLLVSLGVRLDRVVTTGDDAIELAYEERPAALGRAVGINLRLARAAGATERDIEPVREGLRRFLVRLSRAARRAADRAAARPRRAARSSRCSPG